MSAAEWRTDELLATIRRRGNIPVSAEGWDDDDLLAYATDEMRDYIVPLLRRLNEEYLVTYEDQSTASGTAAYDLPIGASHEALRDVRLSDGAGGFYSLTRREPGDVSGVEPGSSDFEFYLQDDQVVLVPVPASVMTLRLKYERRPSKLVLIERGFIVTGIVSDEASFSALDGGLDTLIANQNLDVTSSQRFRLLLQADNVPNDNAGTATFPATITAFEVGDYITLRDESVVPQIPGEFHNLLAQAVVCGYLRASNGPGLQQAEAKLAKMEADAVAGTTPRTENQPRYIVNKYGAGNMRYRVR